MAENKKFTNLFEGGAKYKKLDLMHNLYCHSEAKPKNLNQSQKHIILNECEESHQADNRHKTNKFFRLYLKNTAAFTLAEVLITLVIIGVIAAFTVPTIYAHYTHEAAISKLKKAYSVLNQAYMRAKSDGNDWEYWAESSNTTTDSTSGVTKSFVETYLLPYVIYTKTESQGAHTYVYLNDGTYFYTYKGGCLDFIYDINGDRKPNKEGRDRFRFLYCPYSNTSWIANGVIIPYQKKETKTRDQLLTACKNSGMYCSALIMSDNWTIKEDYPYNI